MVLASVLSLYKPVGMTPLEAIQRYQESHPEYKTVKLGYAGRLDPMAEGVLLVLVGEENKKRKQYEHLSKQYMFDILVGIATDSYDLLGLLTNEADPPTIEVLKQHVPHILQQFTGNREQLYPPYSSKPVNGKPLYWWTREKKLSEIEIPKKRVSIYALDVIQVTSLPAATVRDIALRAIQQVNGKFRQQEIMTQWEHYFQKKRTDVYPVIRFTTNVSSGTYIRAISHDIGLSLQIPTTVIGLVRTAVGAYDQRTAIRL